MLGKGPEPAWQQQPLQDLSLAGLMLDVECSSSSGCLGTGTPSLGCPAVPPPCSARPRLHKVSNSHLLHGLNPVFFLPSSSACAAPASPSLQPLPLPIIPHFSLSSPLCSPLAAAASRSVLDRLCQSRERCRQHSHVWASMGEALWWQEEVAGPGFTHLLLFSVHRRESSSRTRPNSGSRLLHSETLCCSCVADLYIHD